MVDAFDGYGIPKEVAVEFIEHARRIAEIVGVSVGEFFEIMAEVWRASETVVDRIAQSVQKIQDFLERVPPFLPPLSRLQRLWKAERRRADQERERVRLRLYELWAAQRRYKPP